MKIGDFRCCDILSFGIFKDCSGKRMFTLFFKGKCQSEKFLFVDVFCRKQVSDFRLSTGDRTGFIQGNDLNFSCFFK